MPVAIKVRSSGWEEGTARIRANGEHSYSKTSSARATRNLAGVSIRHDLEGSSVLALAMAVNENYCHPRGNVMGGLRER
jgi:hypothetical protein